MLRKTLPSLCIAIPLKGCEDLMLGNVVVGCATKPGPLLLPNERLVAAVGVPYRIRIEKPYKLNVTDSGHSSAAEQNTD
jgi:hypothetical protein